MGSCTPHNQDAAQRFESGYDEGCSNCDGVRCMHFVMRDWWDGGIDECDGWCCPFCRPKAEAFNVAQSSVPGSSPNA